MWLLGHIYIATRKMCAHYLHVLPRDEKQRVIGWQEKSRKPPRVGPRQKLNIFQLSVDAPREGSVHASGTRPGVNTSSYYRRLNFCGRVVSKKVVPLGKSRNRCEHPLTLSQRAQRSSNVPLTCTATE